MFKGIESSSGGVIPYKNMETFPYSYTIYENKVYFFIKNHLDFHIFLKKNTTNNTYCFDNAIYITNDDLKFYYCIDDLDDNIFQIIRDNKVFCIATVVTEGKVKSEKDVENYYECDEINFI